MHTRQEYTWQKDDPVIYVSYVDSSAINDILMVISYSQQKKLRIK